jgi:hypothetical protein
MFNQNQLIMLKSLFKGTILVGLLALTFSLSAQQTYKTGLGLRGGYPSGITVKHFVSGTNAIEGVLSFGWGGFGVTGLYQIHNQIPDAPGFKWYYGGGAHVGTSQATRHNPWSGTTGSKIFLGVDGVVGAEYVFAEVPISLSLDILPILNIVENVGVWVNAGLSIRYTFK